MLYIVETVDAKMWQKSVIDKGYWLDNMQPRNLNMHNLIINRTDNSLNNS